MNITDLTSIISLLIALSVASERLVEITKGFVPWLNQQNSNPSIEDCRKAIVQFLAVAAGIITAWLASPFSPDFVPHDLTGKLALGLLVSGGSGFWNSILTYVTSVKDIKVASATEAKAVTPPAAQ